MRTLRPHLLAAVIALAVALVVTNAAPAATDNAADPDAYLLKQIRHYRATTVRLRGVMGKPARLRAVRHVSLRRAHAIWRHRAAATRRLFLEGPAHKMAWLCIHRYEGAWSDGGSPYYGGLQMDLGFQERYGGVLVASKGTADRWTPLEQMWVAERAYRSGRGFYPWLNTARACGLI